MDGQIEFERGASGKMEDWGLSRSLGYKVVSSPHRPLGLCPTGAGILSRRAGYPLEGTPNSPAPYPVLLLSEARQPCVCWCCLGPWQAWNSVTILALLCFLQLAE